MCAPIAWNRDDDRRCWMGIMGMLVTVVAAMASDYVMEEAYWLIPVMIVPFAIFGVWYAYSVITDRLPELVGLFNSFGGLAAALEGIAVYTDRTAVFSMYTGELLTPTEQKIQLVVLWFSSMSPFSSLLSSPLNLRSRDGDEDVMTMMMMTTTTIMMMTMMMMMMMATTMNR